VKYYSKKELLRQHKIKPQRIRLENENLLGKRLDRKFILDIRKSIRYNKSKSQFPIIAKWC